MNCCVSKDSYPHYVGVSISGMVDIKGDVEEFGHLFRTNQSKCYQTGGKPQEPPGDKSKRSEHAISKSTFSTPPLNGLKGAMAGNIFRLS